MKTKVNWDAVGGWAYIVTFWVVMAIVFFAVVSCSTVSKEEFYREQHRTSESLNRMDSLMQSHWQVQQDSSWHEKVSKQLERIYEKNDTSKTIVVDSTGRVIKETVTIIRERERDNSQETYEREVMMHRLEVMDSTLRASNEQIARMDSLMQASQKSQVKTKETAGWWTRTWSWLKGIFVGLLLAVILYFTRGIWSKLLKL